MILVAGAGGHVGREIVKKAVNLGIKIRCFDMVAFDRVIYLVVRTNTHEIRVYRFYD